MRFDHISQIKAFLKELFEFSKESSFYCIGETAINILEGKIPQYFMILSDIDIYKIYKFFDNVINIELYPFSFSFNYKGEQFFLITMDINKRKQSENYFHNIIGEISEKSLVIPLIYDISKGVFKNLNDIFYLNRKNNKDNEIKSYSNVKIYKVIYNEKSRFTNFAIRYIDAKKVRDKIKNEIKYEEFDENKNPENPLFFYINHILKNIDKQNQQLKFRLSFLFFAFTSFESKILVEELSKTDFFIDLFPILSQCKNHFQSKEYHPEGTLYDHLILTVKEIESNSFELKIAGLLHDIGKIESISFKNNSSKPKYPNHSFLSSKIARKYLIKYENYFSFIPDLIEKICFLIENHMKVAFLPDLEENKIKEIISSKYLKDLLKLLKADLKASSADLGIYKRTISFLQKRLGANFNR